MVGKGHADTEVMLLDGREVRVVKKMPGGRWQILDPLDRKKKWVEVKNLVAVEASNDEAVECSGIKAEGTDQTDGKTDERTCSCCSGRFDQSAFSGGQWKRAPSAGVRPVLRSRQPPPSPPPPPRAERGYRDVHQAAPDSISPRRR